MQNNQDIYRVLQYFLTDPFTRLLNGRCYTKPIMGDPFIFRTLMDEKNRNYLEKTLSNKTRNISFTVNEERICDGSSSSYEKYILVNSNINDSHFWNINGDCIDVSVQGRYVIRCRPWRLCIDMSMRFRVLAVDQITGFIYLCDKKDDYENDIVTLPEYMHYFPDQLKQYNLTSEGFPIDVKDTNKKHLIICKDDNGFKVL